MCSSDLGVPTLRNKDVRGDQYVTLIVDIPKKLSKEAKDALKEFDALHDQSLEGDPAAKAEKTTRSGRKKFWK